MSKSGFLSKPTPPAASSVGGNANPNLLASAPAIVNFFFSNIPHQTDPPALWALLTKYRGPNGHPPFHSSTPSRVQSSVQGPTLCPDRCRGLRLAWLPLCSPTAPSVLRSCPSAEPQPPGGSDSLAFKAEASVCGSGSYRTGLPYLSAAFCYRLPTRPVTQVRSPCHHSYNAKSFPGGSRPRTLLSCLTCC